MLSRRKHLARTMPVSESPVPDYLGSVSPSERSTSPFRADTETVSPQEINVSELVTKNDASMNAFIKSSCNVSTLC